MDKMSQKKILKWVKKKKKEREGGIIIMIDQ